MTHHSIDCMLSINETTQWNQNLHKAIKDWRKKLEMGERNSADHCYRSNNWRITMKALLVLGALLLSASPTHSNAGELIGDTNWKSGNGRLESGAMVTWKTFGSTKGSIYVAFLIPSETNITYSGVRQWSIGAINCKTGDSKFDYIFDTSKPFEIEEKSKELIDFKNDFCLEYSNAFQDSPYYEPEAI